MSSIANSHETSVQNSAGNLGFAGTLDTVGRLAVRYGLVVVLFYIGSMKFTAYEAEAISGLVKNSPLMSWLYGVFSVRGLGVAIGVSELTVAVLIAARPFSAKLSAAGSLAAVGMFLGTLSFMVTTPGVIEPSLGFPALSVMPGQFLVKDVALLGIAIWSFGDSVKAMEKS